MKLKSNYKIILSLIMILCIAMLTILAGCSLLNPIPKQYTQGIKYDRDYPDDALEVYDNAVVYESKNQFGDIILSCGTEDDIDDIIDFYHDFFEDNEILLAGESEDRDEYRASGVSDDYFFEIEVQEADGEYIEDIFEFIILISISELSDEEVIENTTIEATLTPEPTSTPEATVAPTETPAPTQTPVEPELATLNSIDVGLYQTVEIINADGFYDLKMSFSINDDITGTMYYFDYLADERWMANFEYTLIDGIMLFYFNEATWEYYAHVYEDGNLLFSNDLVEMTIINWIDYYSIVPSATEFTAFGDWIYYEPDTGYIETISFFPDSSGYIYNWGGSGEDKFMFWMHDIATNQVTLSDESGDEFIYIFVHKGEVFELVQLNGSTFFYNRVTPDLLSGTMVLESTTDEATDDMTLTFYADYSADVTHEAYGITSEYETSWFVDPSSGELLFLLNDEYHFFSYHYNLYGLFLIDNTTGYYYSFVQVG